MVAPIRTWTISINNQFTNAIQIDQYREACLAFHDLLVSAGWTIQQSFDGSAIQTSGTTNWTATTDIVFGTEGEGSWFVAQSPSGWLTNSETMQLLFYVDENLTGVDAQQARILLAPKGYNTDGTASVGATGTINTIAASLHAAAADTDTFVLNDGINAAVTFVFDDDSSVAETATNRAVYHNGTETADQMRDLIIAAINSAPNLAIFASDGGAGVVDVANLANGIVGNQTITETVANAGFTVAGLSSGANGTTPTAIGAESLNITTGDDIIPWNAPTLGNYATWYTSRGDVMFGVKKTGEEFFSHWFMLLSNEDGNGGGLGDHRWGYFGSSLTTASALGSSRLTNAVNWRGAAPHGNAIATTMDAQASVWQATDGWHAGINAQGETHDIPIELWTNAGVSLSPRYMGQLVDIYAAPVTLRFGALDDSERTQAQRRVCLGDGVWVFVDTADLPFI